MMDEYVWLLLKFEVALLQYGHQRKFYQLIIPLLLKRSIRLEVLGKGDNQLPAKLRE
jgi:hypothetical protein